jgi:hypothetical protein
VSITAAELIAYSVASIPTDDVSTTGGAIDATKRPVFTQIASAEKLKFTSSAADTRTVTIVGRDSTGASITENVTLNGTTPVVSTLTYERILSVIAGTTNGNTVTVVGNTSTTTFGTIPPSEVGFHMMFQNSFSTSSTQTRYEKMFWKNTDSTLTLTSSTMTLTADPSTLMNMGIETSLNGTDTVTNRFTAPSGPTFVGTSTAQNLPSSGNLAAAATIAVWMKQSLGANAAAQKNNFTTQLAGNTT